MKSEESGWGEKAYCCTVVCLFLLSAHFFEKLTIFAGYGIMGQEFFYG